MFVDQNNFQFSTLVKKMKMGTYKLRAEIIAQELAVKLKWLKSFVWNGMIFIFVQVGGGGCKMQDFVKNSC